MIKSQSMSSEVLIYVQNLKHYLTINEMAQKYFNIKGNEEDFFNSLTEISQKNFEDHGEPNLSLDQFEELRKKIHRHRNEPIGLFISLGEYGYVSFN